MSVQLPIPLVCKQDSEGTRISPQWGQFRLADIVSGTNQEAKSWGDELCRRANCHDDLVTTLQIIADHLAKAEKFAAVEYSDELLVPYSDIEKYARQALAKARLL